MIIDRKRRINKKLAVSLKNTTNFSNVVTAKINTPLNSIIEITGRLLALNYNEKNIKNLELIAFSTKNLLENINSIQYYSKINTVNKDENSFDLAMLLDDITSEYQMKVENNNIELTCEYPQKLKHVLIVSDKNLLKQVLYNLLDNAIKFTPNEGQIAIRVIELYNAEKDSITLKLSIKDTGIGIAPDKINDILKPFKQADNSITRKYGGMGLGLSIVQEALASLNSEISIKTEHNKGSVFSFEVKFKTTNKM